MPSVDGPMKRALVFHGQRAVHNTSLGVLRVEIPAGEGALLTNRTSSVGYEGGGPGSTPTLLSTPLPGVFHSCFVQHRIQ
jgi:hypothetical protein